MTAKITIRIEIPVGSTIWAAGNLNQDGTFATKAEDYGGYWTWSAARGISGYDSTLWWPGSFPYQSTTTQGGKSTPTGTGTDGSVCPSGWRLPTRMEVSELIGYPATENENASGAYGSGVAEVVGTHGQADYGLQRVGYNGVLFFPAAGHNGGSDSGTWGAYWASTEYNSGYAYRLAFHSGATYGTLYDPNSKYIASSVRCVR